MATAKLNSRGIAYIAVVGGLCMAIPMKQALADETAVDIGTVQATDVSSSKTGKNSKVESAPHQAPAKTPLNVSQPTSVISKHYMEHNVVPSSNYDEIIKNTPSVTSISPNGPGLMENMGLSLRGFQDGQYNITFDGIPWGDSNDFTHHSTSYFMAHDIGQISVDRGPGTAATVGPATFGGTISLQSIDPTAEKSLSPYMTFGSFNTRLLGVEYNTGTLKKYNGARALLDFETLRSDGYLSYSGQQRQNGFLKVTRPVGDNTRVTFAAMYNQLHQNVPVGATKAQIKKYGPNYGLSNDPNKQNYYGYNYDNIHTDFEYIDVQSYLGDAWSMDNKVYTDAYYHHGFNGADPNGGTPNGTTWGPNDVPGQKMAMIYRSWGDFARFAKSMNIGTFNTGLWYDHQTNTRWEYNVDWTLQGALDNNPSAGSYSANRLMNDSLDSVQPYAELAWKVTPALTVTPGLKYAYFRRSIDAQVNQGSGGPLNYSKTWGSLLPSVDAHYKIRKNWVAYVQAAKGFLAPNLNVFYTKDPSASNVKPEETWNYQTGTTWKSHRLALSGDLYYIDFNNKVDHRTKGGNTIFYNVGGAIYKGAEVEGTYYVGGGFSVYANASYNSAKVKSTGLWIANAPKTTGAAGVIYNRAGWYGSIIDKYVGHRYGDDGETQPLGSFNVADASLGYTFHKHLIMGLEKAKVNFQVKNLFNNKNIDALAGYTGDSSNTPLYWTIPERSYYISLTANF